MRYKLTIAYDGTDFCGWQKQEPPAGMNVDPAKVMSAADDPASRLTLRTVQEVVERAVREVVRQPVELIGASRTDAGVHARCQVAAFACDDDAWPLSRGTTSLLRALNSRLPDDVLITAAEPVAEGFNPIVGAISKAYSYTLHVSPHRPLWNRRYVHHVWVPLDLERMQDAAARLVGEHDFAAFAAAGHGRQSTVRTVYSCDVTKHPLDGTLSEPGIAGVDDTPDWSRQIRIDISGNGFLWNMIRIIAGTLVDVGRGRLSPEDVTLAIESGDRRQAGPTLPPTGLCLEWVKYEDATPP